MITKVDISAGDFHNKGYYLKLKKILFMKCPNPQYHYTKLNIIYYLPNLVGDFIAAATDQIEK